MAKVDDEKVALHELYPNGDENATQSSSLSRVKALVSRSSRPTSAPDPAGSPRRPSLSSSRSRGTRPHTSRRHSKSHVSSSPRDSSSSSSPTTSSSRLSRLPSKNYRTYPPLHASVSSTRSPPSKPTPSGATHTPQPSLDSSFPGPSLPTHSLSPVHIPSSVPTGTIRLTSRGDDNSEIPGGKHKRLDSDTQLSIIFNGIRFRAIPIQSSNKPVATSSSNPPSPPAPTTSSSVPAPRKQKRRSQNNKAPARAYQVSSPSNVQHVMHVEWNEDLQAYTGIPDVWTQDIPQSALRFSTLELPSHINPRLDTESEHGDSQREKRKKAQSCIPSKRNAQLAQESDDDELNSSAGPGGSGSYSAYRGRRRSNDYRAEYLASVDVEYERAKHKAMIAELPGNAPGPRVFPGPRAHFQQPSYRNNDSILKLSVRHYLEKLGFDDLDKEFRVENLRELLLQRLRLAPERSTRDSLVQAPYAIKQAVFSYLDVKSYLHACRTCSQMAALLDEPLLWCSFVRNMHTEQGFLHQQYAARHRGWKVSYLAMQRIVRDPSYCDCIWNIVVQGDTRVGRNRLVYTLGDAMLQRNRKHCTKDIQDDPAIDAVTGIYRFRIDFVTRRVVIEDRIIKLQVWDGGLVLGDSAVFGAAHIVLMLLDLTEKGSLKRLPSVVRETFQATKNANSNPRILLVGNTRGEVEKQRAISFKHAKRFANERGLVYLEANIDNPNEVDKAFVQLTEEFAKNENLELHRAVRAKKAQQCLVM